MKLCVVVPLSPRLNAPDGRAVVNELRERNRIRRSRGGFLSRVRLLLRVVSLEETWERELGKRSYLHAVESGESGKFLGGCCVFYLPRFVAGRQNRSSVAEDADLNLVGRRLSERNWDEIIIAIEQREVQALFYC